MRKIISFVLVITVLVSVGKLALAQQKASRVYLKLYYEVENDDAFLLASLKSKINKKFAPVQSAELNFTIQNDSAQIELGTATTNNKGEVRFKIPAEQATLRTEAGIMEFGVAYAGSEAYKKAKSTVEATPTSMVMKLTDDNQVQVTANSLKSAAEPISESTITFFVKRSFALQKLGEASLAEGEVTFDFPKDIPGDHAGNLTVVCRLENDEVGKITKSAEANWGTIPQRELPLKSGAKFAYLLFMLIAVVFSFAVVQVLKKVFV